MELKLARLLGCCAAVAAAAAMLPAAASAAIENPGPVTAQIAGGTVSFTGSSSPINLPSGSMQGSVAPDGTLKFPEGGISFTESDMDIGIPPAAKIRILPAGDGTGTIDPASGEMSLSLALKVGVSHPSTVGDGCTIGPINVAPLATNVPGGAPFSIASGAATLANNTFKVDAASSAQNCKGLEKIVNERLGLVTGPSQSNSAVLSIKLSPAPKGQGKRAPEAPKGGSKTITFCGDGKDNDGDGLSDMRDPGCSTPFDMNEFNSTGGPRWYWPEDGVPQDGPPKTIVIFGQAKTTVASKTLYMDGRKLAVPLDCEASFGRSCNGLVTIKSNKLKLGTLRYKLGAGESNDFLVTLKASKKQLRKALKGKLTLTVAPQGAKQFNTTVKATQG